MEPIAVIGMACRVPGAGDLDRFWRNVTAGVQARTQLSRERMLAAGAPAGEVDDPDYVAAAYLLDDMENFDAGLFGMTPREASLADPQHRLFLELCHAALENAGWNPATFAGDIAVYGGRGMEAYRWLHLYRNREVMSLFDHTTLGIGNHADTFTTLVSHKLDLRGPSVGVYTACSTSLVAIHLAAEALRAGECDMALAGGTNIELPAERGYRYRDGAGASADGYARPFDAEATGTVWGSGGGAVLLKRLEDAVADGDHVHAVIRGNAINNDGAAKAGFTAPSVQGQVAVIAAALAMAGVAPEEVGYVEAFGLGSPISDQIEVEALRTVFGHGTAQRQWCALGSVKANIGHLSQGAGVVSFIKAVLALEHRMIPPTAGFAVAHPELDFASSPFYVNAALASWESDTARLAAVSAFGVGGTNAHVVLEEHTPVRASAEAAPAEQLIQVSARSAKALEAAVERLATHLEHTAVADLGDVAHTLRVGRVAYPHRVAVVADHPASAAVALREARKRHAGVASATPPRLVVLFPGEVAFADALRAWQSLGAPSAALIGVGVGELVAATAAGVFDEATGARLAQLRERLLATAPTGVLLGISAAPDRFHLPSGLHLAAVNGPAASVVCGDDEAIGEFAAQLAIEGITARPMPGRHPLPDKGIAEEFGLAVAQARPGAPQRPYLSTVTGTAVPADPHHWAAYLQATVLFGQCLSEALSEPGVVVDCGAGQLSRFAHLYLAKGAPKPIALQPSPLLAAGQLWTHGLEVRLESNGRRVPLPGYPYERTRHWVDPDLTAQPEPAAPKAPTAQDDAGGLSAIWVQLLGVDGVRADDDFFDLGGTSLLAVQLVARVREVYGVRLPMRSVFDTPTVREMAAKVAQLQAAAK
ncbi:hypothetical protein Rhe02_71160 [Rhizocola hellebori]|uniref:Carrier domain-containing protein n=1 Tax=Rhizocola hellebori TaxID=1392758 RepID=A0A8J3QG79_9ACTN|nr:beta-ketoacyl synthase N-terminal-like domain-containing protein [Rhizocola hellebori]GIH09049.1 hypothetical protein Rhe02_71160 [Rhizocola hellebori]